MKGGVETSPGDTTSSTTAGTARKERRVVNRKSQSPYKPLPNENGSPNTARREGLQSTDDTHGNRTRKAMASSDNPLLQGTQEPQEEDKTLKEVISRYTTLRLQLELKYAFKCRGLHAD